MIKRLFQPRRRRQAPRNPTGLADRRRVPAPLPRMRWY
jgi:hypothetical protein